MNKQKFLRGLKRKLSKLKREERSKYIAYYEEMISDIVESGVSEEEAVARQGSIRQIAEDILADAGQASLNTRDWPGICLTAAAVILGLNSLIALIFRMQARISMSAAVGIIGGADGPTSIFVAGKIGRPWGLYLITAAVVIVTIVYFIRKRK